MVKRTRFDESDCPVARSVDAIGDWWSLLIVRDAFDGSRRFGEFQRSLGVAKNILASRLRDLVAGGIFDMAPAGRRQRVPRIRADAQGQGSLPGHRRAAAVGRGPLLRSRRTALKDGRPAARASAPGTGGPLGRRAAARTGRHHGEEGRTPRGLGGSVRIGRRAARPGAAATPRPSASHAYDLTRPPDSRSGRASARLPALQWTGDRASRRLPRAQ